VRCPWLLAQTKVATIFGHFSFSFLLLLTLLAFTPEGIVIGFQIFAWAPKKNNKNSGEKIKFEPPGGRFLGVFF
jgi:hypothetical protein